MNTMNLISSFQAPETHKNMRNSHSINFIAVFLPKDDFKHYQHADRNGDLQTKF